MKKLVLPILCAAMIAQVPSMAMSADMPMSGYENCSCVVPATASKGSVGRVSSAQGEVLVDGVSAKVKNNLSLGSYVMVGRNSSATVSVGTGCNVRVDSNSQVTISQPDGAGSNLCVSNTSEVAQAVPSGGNNAWLSVLLIGGGVAGIIALANDDDDNPASN